jgi:phosphatidylinositol-3-phosphatase
VNATPCVRLEQVLYNIDTSSRDTGEEMDRPSSPDSEATGAFPMPSPLAVAFAVIALLAFGVGLGVYTRPEGRARVLLAASPTGASSGASTSSTTTGGAGTSLESEAEASSGGAEGSSETEAESKGETASSSEEASEGEAEPGGGASKGDEGSKRKGAAGGRQESSKLPPIEHVFVIVLGEQGYEAAFGAGSEAPYLAKTLREQGELVGDYFGVAPGQLANEIALVSGQGPTPQTASNCPVYEALTPGKAGSEGQALGSGCVYPIDTLTIGDQLTAAGDTWKAYAQGLGEGSAASSQATCPNPVLGGADPNSTPTASDPYVTWRDPFLYFRSTIEGAGCAAENVGIGQLAKDLESAASTPSLSYISPDLCEDGDPQPCAPGAPAGLKAAEGFLRRVVPEIESSAAYREGGLIAITFDEAPQSGPHADSTGCCATPRYPNLPAGGATSSATGLPTGGGRVGLLLISKYVKPGSSYVTGQYNHFSVLASIEALFKLKTLGYAGNVQLPTFERALYNAHR